MRFYEMRAPDPTPRKVCVRQECDLCHAVAHAPGQWDAGSYRESETEIQVAVRRREGSSYPEGGCGTQHVIDLCPKCFKDRLVPWLVSQGAQIEDQNWAW